MAPPSDSLAEDLEILRISPPSVAWTSMLPQGTTPAATFYLFTAEASPTTSDDEGQAQAHAHNHNRIEPPEENVDAAAYWMARFLGVFMQDGDFAVAGGCAMRFHGSIRRTFDVDICVKPRSGMSSPLRAMLQAPRFILPSAKYTGQVLRSYLKTGPSYGDNIDSNRAVKIDFMLNEFLPHRFTDHIEKITVNAQEIWVLDRQCLLKCKLSAYGNRAAEKDYEDIKTLIFGYPDEVQGYKHKLDQESVEFFINEGIVPLESQETVQLVKRILMLTEPSSLSSTS